MNIRPSLNLTDEEGISPKTTTPGRGTALNGVPDFGDLLAKDQESASDKVPTPSAPRGSGTRRTSRPPRADAQAAAGSPAVPPPVTLPAVVTVPVGTDAGAPVPDFRGLIAADDVRASSTLNAPRGAHDSTAPGSSPDLSPDDSAAETTAAVASVAPVVAGQAPAAGYSLVAIPPAPAAVATAAPAGASDKPARAPKTADAQPDLRAAAVPAPHSGDVLKVADAPAAVRVQGAPAAQHPATRPAPMNDARPTEDAVVRSADTGGAGDKPAAGGHSDSNRRPDADADAAQSAPATPAVTPSPPLIGAAIPSPPQGDKTLTPVNSMSASVKAPDPAGPEDALTSVRSAQNQRVMRSVAQGELDHPDLGRVAVTARLKDGEVDVRVSAQRPETATFLMPRADAMAADVRAANVPLGRVDVESGGGGALPRPSTASGDGSGSSRDRSQPQGRDGEGQVVVAPPPKRVRIVL